VVARLGLGSIAPAVVAFGACTDPDLGPGPQEPAELVITPVDGARLCAGTERWAAIEIERVEAETGLVPAVSLPISLGQAAVDERCVIPGDTATVLGCTLDDHGSLHVFTTPDALSHELVHGLRRSYELETRAMFEEGFAEAIDGSDAYPRYVALDPAEVSEASWPEALVQQDYVEFRSEERYRVATHFVAFLQAEHGPEAVASFMTGGIDGSAEAALIRFETSFGTTLAERAQAWRDAGEQGFGRGDPCSEGITPIPPDEAVELVVEVDCDDPDTLGLQGVDELAWVRRCVSTAAGVHTVALDTASGRVRWDSVPGTCAEGSSELDAAPKRVEAGVEGVLELAACTWAVTFESTEDQPERFVLALGPG